MGGRHKKRKGEKGGNRLRRRNGGPPSVPVPRGSRGLRSTHRSAAPKTDISLCMIVRDEQETLPRCLKSAMDILSEIVVVDTGSSDDTAAVARRFGARVIPHHWNDDFSAARNVALRNASRKWILVLDADETLDRADLPEIAALCRNTEFKAFEFVTRNYVTHSNWSNWVPNDGGYPAARDYPGWYPSGKVRLFRNNPRVRYSGEIHELVEPSLKELNWRVKRVHIPVHHFMWERPQDRLRQKRVLYRECARKKVLGNPHDSKALYEYGVHCAETDQHGEAVQAFSRALKAAPDFTDRYPGLTSIYGYLGANLIKMSLYNEALTRLRQGISRNPGNCDLYHLQGVSFMGLGRNMDALCALEKAVELNPGFAKAHETLGIAYHRAGQKEKAVRSLRRALEVNPGMTEAARLLRSLTGGETPGGSRPGTASDEVKLSVCVIARDEEENLPGCIESIGGIADEIVVVDTGSEDETVQRATELGARVFHFPWCDDFSAARNESIKHARGDYILWMDADDRLDPADAPKLNKFKDNLPPHRKTAYLLLLQNRKNGTDDDICYQMRLFPNLPGVAFQGRVHEQVVYSLEKLGIEQHQAEIRIVHRGYSDRRKMEAKVRRNISLLSQEEARQPGDFIRNFQLAGSYFFIGETERAIHHMEAAVHGENGFRRSPFWHISSYVQLGWMYKTAGQTQRALETLQEALAMDPGNGLAKFFIGEIRYSQGKYREALETLSALSDGDFQVTAFALPIDKIRYFLRFYRGRCHEELGQQDEAARQYRMAMAIQQDSPAVRKRLSTVYLKQGKYSDAEGILNRLSRVDAQDPAVQTNLGLIFSRRGDTEKAEQAYKNALDLDPRLSEARVNLGHLLLGRERYREARFHLEEAEKQDNRWVDVQLGLSCAMAAEGDIQGCLDKCDTLLGLLGLPRNHTLDSLADLSHLYLLMGEKLKGEGRRAEAGLALNTALFLDPECGEAYMGLGSIHEQAGELDEAIGCYQKALLSSPSNGEIFSLMEGCYIRMGAHEAAQLCRRKAEELSSALL